MSRRGAAVALALALAVAAVLLVVLGGEDEGGDPGRSSAPGRSPAAALPKRGAFSATSVFNTVLPDDVALSDAKVAVDGVPAPVNPSVGRELAAHAVKDGRSNTSVNVHSFTAPITVVPARQRLQPVRLCFSAKECVPSWAQRLAQVFRGVAADGTTYLGGGVPIPDGFVPPEDNDAEAVLYQPGYVAPDGKRGRLYELWHLRPNDQYDRGRPVSAANPRWAASWGGRMVGTADRNGQYNDCWWYGCGYQADTKADPDAWGRPNSQAEQKSWGAAATSLSLLGTLIDLADCRRGAINHAVGVQVPEARREAWWPAQRTDGFSDGTAIVEGMRLTFPRGTAKPDGLTKLGSAVWDAAYRYGLIIDDRTWSFLNLRADPRCARQPLWDGVAAYDQLRGFPWADLRVVAEGSPEDVTPTTAG